jgi:hypothetical protein
MMTETYKTDDSRPEAAPSRGSSVLNLMLSPAAFAVVAVFNYLVGPAACQLGVTGFNVIRILTFLVSLVGVLVIVWAGYQSYRNVQRARATGASSDNSARFLGVGGIMLSALFLALTVIVGLSGLSFRPCEPV